MREERKAASQRRRRIIVNNDGDDAIQMEQTGDLAEGMTPTDGELREGFLRARTTGLLGSHVDTISYNTCMAGLTFSHQTRIGQFLSKKLYPRCISDDLIEQYGRDTLGVQVDFCHENGLEIFWCLRMNDGHDAYPAGTRRWTYGLDPFKRDHPEYLMGEPGDWDKYPDSSPRHAWSCLDYGRPEVRDHIFELIREVCEAYDVDGVEMDFFRAARFFRPTLDDQPVEQEHLDMMTDLMRRIRTMADEVGRRRGRPILLAPRIPITVELGRFYGLDVERWLEEGLIDIIIAGYGSGHQRPMGLIGGMVELGHRYGVRVNACLSWAFWVYWAFLDSGYEGTMREWFKAGKSLWDAVNSWSGMLESWRGAAMNAWSAGADGLYTFNVWDPDHPMFWEIGEPDALARLNKIYGVDYLNDRARAMELKEGKATVVNLRVGEDVHAATVSELRLRAHLIGLTGRDDVTFKLNGAVLDDLKPAGVLEPSAAGHWMECRLNPAQIEIGDNNAEMILGKRDESAQGPVLFDGLLLHVRHKG